MVNLSALSTELIKKGWKLAMDVEPVLPGMKGDIEYVSFLRADEIFISDEELVERAFDLGAELGQRDAEWIVEHQGMLSECPEEVRYLLFPGTAWEHLNGAWLYVYLYRTGKEEKKWDLYVLWMDFGFSDRVRLVRPAQATS